MYIYSLLALALYAYLYPHIRARSPFENLLLAYFYALDMLVNWAYTVLFGVSWFALVSANDGKGGEVKVPGAGTINDTAGFTNPEKPGVGSVVVNPTTGETVAEGVARMLTRAAESDPSVGHGLGLAESLPSIFVILLFSLIRIYFCIIIPAYARQVLRNYIVDASSARAALHNDGETAQASNPFAEGTQLGQGWRGKAGRWMTGVGRGYWIGEGEGDNDWVRVVGGRFSKRERGTSERERRARSGTGPPVPKLGGLPKLQIG